MKEQTSEETSKKATSKMANRVLAEKSESAIKMISKLALAGAILNSVLILVINQAQPTLAGHAALSEVWSETDGLRMKYSTNHGDLLSTKGSEMSLSSDQKQHVEPAGEEAETPQGRHSSDGGALTTQSEESTAGEGESAQQSQGAGGGESAPSQEGEGDSSEQQQAEGNGSGSEQGAADSRKTEKVIPSTAGRVLSYSSLNAGPKQASPSRSHFKSSDSSTSAVSGFDFSGSSPADQMVNDNGEVSSADADSTDAPSAAEAPSTGANRFRQPGRHFKEAVKMASAQQQEASSGDDSTSDDASSEQTSENKRGFRGPPVDGADESADLSDRSQPSWNPAAGKQQESNKRAQQFEEIADFEQTHAPETRSRSLAEQADEPAPDAPAGQYSPGLGQGYSGAMDDEQNLGNFRSVPPAGPGMFYDGSSAQSSRSLLAASSQKERSQSPLATSAGQRQSGQASKPVAPTASKQTFRQLSYFKRVHDQTSANDARQAHGRPGAAEPDNSPDSVRDNFISPGHYPGSMPHLTQAASEIAQSKSAKQGLADSASSAPPTDQKSAVGTKDDEQPKAINSSSQTNSDNKSSSNEINQSIPSDTSNQAGEQAAEEQQKLAAESKALLSIVVTPSPDSQPESQQIMAPILVTTTTMAPLLPTPTPPASISPQTSTSTSSPAPNPTIGVTTNSTGTGPSGATAGQTPALKRFKFRKYR